MLLIVALRCVPGTQQEPGLQPDRLPLGEWEFRAWHERWGYLKTKPWPKGRFTQKIEEGKRDLGTIGFEIPQVKMQTNPTE